MAQQPVPPIGADVSDLMSGAPTVPPIGADVSALMTGAPAPADFRTTNVKDVYGHAVVGGGLGGYLEEATPSINPFKINQFIQSAFWDPKATLKGIHAAQDVPRQEALVAFKQGDYVTGARKLFNWLIPLIGPRIDEAVDFGEQGDIPRMLGATTDVAINLFGHKAVPAQTLPAMARIGTRQPAGVRQAVDWGLREGIPVDVGTASGNRFVRGIQRASEESLGGSFIAEAARGRQAEALTATGARLAEQTAPGRPATPETAGTAVRQEVVQTGQARAAEARQAYREVRDAEGNILNAEYVPEDLSPQVKQRMREELGEIPTAAEIQELRRIREELDAVPYTPGKLVQEGVGSSDTTYIPRSGGAPVYHDILQEAPGTAQMTRAEVQRAIEVALKTGRMSNAARGALIVAKKRLSEGGWKYSGLSSPLLPPDAGAVPVVMALPVDLRAATVALTPLYQQLLRQKELTGILPGAKGRTLMALDTLLTAGDHAPLSVVDAALSDLKALARGEIPELKTAGEGVAAAAVRELDAQVKAAAERAGPDVLAALERGRAGTRAKYVARDLVKRLGKTEEGVGVYRKATAAHDANVRLLRQLQTHAPESLPLVGRAVVEELLQKATAEGPGAFQRTAGVLADWQRLGPETKRLLFRDPGHIQALDNFFLLAKKLAENPNPSGTALTLLKSGEVGGWFAAPGLGIPYTITAPILAKLLLDPRATRLLLQGLRLPVSAKAARVTWAGQLGRLLESSPQTPGLVPLPVGAEEPATPLAGSSR